VLVLNDPPAGTVSFVAVPDGYLSAAEYSDPAGAGVRGAPTAAEVAAGTGPAGAGQVSAGTTAVTTATAGTNVTVQVTGLTPTVGPSKSCVVPTTTFTNFRPSFLGYMTRHEVARIIHLALSLVTSLTACRPSCYHLYDII